jgi:Periplasmic copper-binding protein (NosD)
VVGNRITTNSGGVLVTDEFGPSHGNMIEGNIVNNNTLDCGVTLAGHNPNAVSAGSPEPTVAGVFNNTVQDNLLNGNGVAGQGAGVVLASPLAGGGVYGNRILDNQMAGNGLAGVTLHSHAPGQDLNGNIVMGNTILRNNLDGDPDFFPIVDPSTTGVIVATTPAGPVGITVSHNLIENDVFGIWTTPGVTLHGVTSNQFLRVTTPVFQAS